MYGRAQDGLNKMCGLRIHSVIIKDNFVGRLKFCQGLLALFSNLRHLVPALPGYLTGIYTSVHQKLNVLSPSMSSGPLTLSSPFSFLIGWHWHHLGWEALDTPFFVAHSFPPILQFIKLGRSGVDMLSFPFLSCLFPISTTQSPHPSWGLCNHLQVMAMVPITSGQVSPHLDHSFNLEYFLLSAQFLGQFYPSSKL